MKNLYKKGSVFVVAVVLYLVGQYFRGVWFLGSSISVCRNSVDQWGTFCNSPYIDTFGYPLITAGEFLAVIAVVLLFANERALRRWFKFSLFYIPIVSVLVLLIFPIPFSWGLGLDVSGVLTINYDVGVHLAGWLYLFATLYIVIREYFRKTAK